MIRKLANLWVFYKSTLVLNLAISVLCFLFGGFSEFLLMFISFGFAISILIKEVRAQKDYLFYYNNGFSKLQLWFYAGIVNIGVALFLSCVYVFIFHKLCNMF